MKRKINNILRGLICLIAVCIYSYASAGFLSPEVKWGEDIVSLDNIIPEFRNLSFSSSQPAKWKLYRKVIVKSSDKEDWIVVGSCASKETIWQTPAPEIMGELPANFLPYNIERDNLRLTLFKISCDVNGSIEEKEFLWNVYPKAPEMNILSWTFDLDIQNRRCENSNMELEIECVGQKQYAIGITPQEYFTIPDDLSSVKFSYVRFISDENIYKTIVNGQWGWIMHVVAINHFGSTPGNYLLTNNYIANDEQLEIIKKWNPDIPSIIEEVSVEDTGLYAISGRTILLSNEVIHANLYDINGLNCSQWTIGGVYHLNRIPCGLYLLRIVDKSSNIYTYRIFLR